MKGNNRWGDTNFNQLIYDIIDLQNESLKHLKVVDKCYDNIKMYIDKFKDKYNVDEQFIWLFAENKITAEDLEYLIESQQIIKRGRKHEVRHK